MKYFKTNKTLREEYKNLKKVNIRQNILIERWEELSAQTLEECKQRKQLAMLWEANANNNRKDAKRLREALAKSETAHHELKVIANLYETILLTLITEFKGEEIVFEPEQVHILTLGKGDNETEHAYTFNVGQICCVDGKEIWIEPSYNESSEIEDGIVIFTLPKLINLSNIDEVIQSKIRRNQNGNKSSHNL